MIKYIALHEAITIPGRISTMSTWNHNEHGKLLRVEESADGFLFICGALDDKNHWQPTGDVVEVYRSMVKYVTRTRTKEQKK